MPAGKSPRATAIVLADRTKPRAQINDDGIVTVWFDDGQDHVSLVGTLETVMAFATDVIVEATRVSIKRMRDDLRAGRK